MKAIERRTIRKYTSEKIDEKTLNYILNCGQRASNCGNMQLYSIIVTQSEEGKKRLAPLHFNQPMVEDCAVVLTVCVDVNRFNKWCEINSAQKSLNNFLFLNVATIDAAVCTQAMAQAAEEKGLGICYLGTVNYMVEPISEALNLPDGVIPVTCLTIGYPKETPPVTERLPLSSVVHYEEYKDYTDANIKAMYRDIEQNPSNQDFVKENSKENLAQVFSEVRYPKQMNEEFSEKYEAYLKEHFFSK
ncbi:MAG: nitroreductase family protein [Bacteroidales bacterium]|nr:nitroreductase family protein [Bacteroidales bacterium]